jgi:O-antigen/teichoic acid export membrane protein
MSLAQRSVSSVTWNVATNLIILPVGLVQSILLARLLPVEYFGIYAGVIALTELVNQIFEFGLNDAFIHRAPETENEEHAVNVLFTLRFVFYAARAALLLAVAFVLFTGLRQLALAVIAATGFVTGLASIPGLILIRRVEHRRLAVMGLTNALLVAVFSIYIAATSASIWALLISSIITLLWTIILFHLWRPIWRPRFVWDRRVIRYYFSFGSRAQVGRILDRVLDTIDDLWANIFLGDLALGYYSRAYKFATYPRAILNAPVEMVASGTYAELKGDRKRLSKAFFRVNALMVRSGFLLGGWLFVIAPEFIRLLLGDQWLPMLDTFRLMLVFTLLDPLKDTIANAIVALGMPEKVISARFIQLIILGAGLFILGPRFGTVGVAIAVDLMLVVGIALLLHYVRPYVDVSLLRLFAAPAIALAIGMGLTGLLLHFWDASRPEWQLGIVKTLVIGIGYLAVLWILEGKELYRTFLEVIDASGIARLGK